MFWPVAEATTQAFQVSAVEKDWAVRFCPQIHSPDVRVIPSSLAWTVLLPIKAVEALRFSLKPPLLDAEQKIVMSRKELRA